MMRHLRNQSVENIEKIRSSKAIRSVGQPIDITSLDIKHRVDGVSAEPAGECLE